MPDLCRFLLERCDGTVTVDDVPGNGAVATTSPLVGRARDPDPTVPPTALSASRPDPRADRRRRAYYDGRVSLGGRGWARGAGHASVTMLADDAPGPAGPQRPGIALGALRAGGVLVGHPERHQRPSTTAPKTTVSTNVASTGPIAPITGGVKGKPGYLVYWDQNEEVDFLSMPSGTQGQLLPAWDLNGQMCILPDGRFVGGYDPTLPGPAQPRQRQALQATGRRRGARRAQRLVQRTDPVRAGPLQDAGPDHRQ